jgi:hypothetical protein
MELRLLLELDSQRVHAAAPDVNLQTLWPTALPMLKRFGYADGVRPAARRQNIDGVLNFSGGQLSSVKGGMEIAAGLWAPWTCFPRWYCYGGCRSAR